MVTVLRGEKFSLGSVDVIWDVQGLESRYVIKYEIMILHVVHHSTSNVYVIGLSLT